MAFAKDSNTIPYCRVRLRAVRIAVLVCVMLGGVATYGGTPATRGRATTPKNADGVVQPETALPQAVSTTDERKQPAKRRKRTEDVVVVPTPPVARLSAEDSKKLGGWQPREPDYDRITPLIDKIGQHIVDELGEVPSRAYLIVHIADNWANARLFVDRGKFVQQQAPNGELPTTAMKLWKVENAGRPKPLRWVYLEYDIARKKVKVHFVYPEEIAQGSGIEDWVEKGLRQRFRTKPVVSEERELNDDAPRS